MQFETLGLAPNLMAALTEAGLKTPTPIQAEAIPLALKGHDVLGLAQTGTGKTLAFGLPLIQAVHERSGKPAPLTVKALVLAPTRELVNQIATNLRDLTKGSRIRVTTVVGGQSIGKQISFLARGTDILVATPGRLIDLMERGSVDLSTVSHLVLDEADQMLDMGFIHALRQIEPALGTPRQTMLFSATMPKKMEELAGTYLTNPKRVQVSPPGKAADKITQSVHFVSGPEKPFKLRELLSKDPEALTLVFARTKHGAEKLMKRLVEDGYAAGSVHGNKSQGQRDRAIKAFRSGEIKVLVATDVAARGIDIPGVAYVINYDLPEVADNYVHRIGRTARAGREGEAFALCAPDEFDLLKQIEKVMKIEIATASGERPTRAVPGAAARRRGGAQGKGHGGHGSGRKFGPRGGAGGNAAGRPSGKPRRSKQRKSA